MRRRVRNGVQACLLLGCVFAVAGCSTDGVPAPKLWDPQAPPDWAVSSVAQGKTLARAGSIGDIVDSTGRCMADSFSVPKDPAADQAKIPEKGLAPTAIALEMTECEVVKRAGPADRVDITVNERGERIAAMTYAEAVRPGLYRFRSGRLFSIERLPEPVAQTKRSRSPSAKKEITARKPADQS
jgi:hypothetical protein